MGIKCFWIEPTGQLRRSLYRYTKYTTGWSCAEGWHRALSGVIDTISSSDPRARCYVEGGGIPHDDPRWPKTCSKCEYVFVEGDEWETYQEEEYRRTDTGELTSQSDAAPGAMWDAHWLVNMYAPTDDGRCLMVRCPGGHDWVIDSRASNCTMPDDMVHHCWVRHGEPPNIHVDKNGTTCGAGAGSIIAGDYHGFLHNGEFT